MVSAQEIRTEESQIRLPVMVLETGQLHPNSQIPAAESLRNLSPYEVNLSGTCVGSAGNRMRALSVSEQSALGKVIASPPRSSVRRRLPFCPSIGTRWPDAWIQVYLVSGILSRLPGDRGRRARCWCKNSNLSRRACALSAWPLS